MVYCRKDCCFPSPADSMIAKAFAKQEKRPRRFACSLNRRAGVLLPQNIITAKLPDRMSVQNLRAK
jgi:hypothetical protein